MSYTNNTALRQLDGSEYIEDSKLNEVGRLNLQLKLLSKQNTIARIKTCDIAILLTLPLRHKMYIIHKHTLCCTSAEHCHHRYPLANT
jgi:hypothetical protein